MAGGTTFHFVMGGIDEALTLAKQAAGDKDVKIGGGVSTVRRYFLCLPVLACALGFSVTEQGQGARDPPAARKRIEIRSACGSHVARIPHDPTSRLTISLT